MTKEKLELERTMSEMGKQFIKIQIENQKSF